MRLPDLSDLSVRQQEISDWITARRGGTRGPFLVWLRSPELCEKVEALGAYCRYEILSGHFVSDETFAAALGEFGEQGLVDLVGSLGNYSMLAMLLNAFQVDLQPVEPPFPDVRGYARVTS
jgi:hypothetical protein